MGVVNLKAAKPEELDMSNPQVRSEPAIEAPRAQRVDMKLEVVVIPVSDVDRAKSSMGAWGGGSTPTSPPVTTTA